MSHSGKREVMYITLQRKAGNVHHLQVKDIHKVFCIIGNGLLFFIFYFLFYLCTIQPL